MCIRDSIYTLPIFKDVVLEITNAKASSPPAAHPVVTISPTPNPTLIPASTVDINILFILGSIGPILSNISYKTEKLIDANIEYIKNFFPKYLYPINKSDNLLLYLLSLAECCIGSLAVVKVLTLHLLLCCLNNKSYRLQMQVLLSPLLYVEFFLLLAAWPFYPFPFFLNLL